MKSSVRQFSLPETDPGTDNFPMSDSSKAIQWYEANAREVAERHEALDPEKVHHWWLDQLPNSPTVILDVGAGSGRDAAWLAGKNHDVIAVEPVTAMIREGLRRRPHPNFRWMEDELASLHKISRLGISFDLVLISAVWMHVKPADRNRAFRKVIQLLKGFDCAEDKEKSKKRNAPLRLFSRYGRMAEELDGP